VRIHIHCDNFLLGDDNVLNTARRNAWLLQASRRHMGRNYDYDGFNDLLDEYHTLKRSTGPVWFLTNIAIIDSAQQGPTITLTRWRGHVPGVGRYVCLFA
jgi:hypothetical protein